MILGFTSTALQQPIQIQIQSISKKPIPIFPQKTRKFSSFSLKPQSRENPRNPRNLIVAFAEKGNEISKEPNERERESGKEKKKKNGNNRNRNNGGEEEGELKEEDQRPRFNLRWVELLLDPDPENILAVGLTGLLTWASVQILWQLFFISVAIIVAALKYSFIAALLIFILITLL